MRSKEQLDERYKQLRALCMYYWNYQPDRFMEYRKLQKQLSDMHYEYNKLRMKEFDKRCAGEQN